MFQQEGGIYTLLGELTPLCLETFSENINLEGGG